MISYTIILIHLTVKRIKKAVVALFFKFFEFWNTERQNCKNLFDPFYYLYNRIIIIWILHSFMIYWYIDILDWQLTLEFHISRISIQDFFTESSKIFQPQTCAKVCLFFTSISFTIYNIYIIFIDRYTCFIEDDWTGGSKLPGNNGSIVDCACTESVWCAVDTSFTVH